MALEPYERERNLTRTITYLGQVTHGDPEEALLEFFVDATQWCGRNGYSIGFLFQTAMKEAEKRERNEEMSRGEWEGGEWEGGEERFA